MYKGLGNLKLCLLAAVLTAGLGIHGCGKGTAGDGAGHTSKAETEMAAETKTEPEEENVNTKETEEIQETRQTDKSEEIQESSVLEETSGEAESGLEQQEELEELMAGTDFVVPDSQEEYISWDTAQGLNLDQLIIARNEIYARHGRKFKNEKIQAYFESKEWYHGTIEADQFRENMLSLKEQMNVSYLKSFEGKPGLGEKRPYDTLWGQLIKQYGIDVFYLIGDSVKDCGDYYQVDATFYLDPYVLKEEYDKAKVGDSLTVVSDEISGDTVVMVKKAEREADYSGTTLTVSDSQGERLYIYTSEDGGMEYSLADFDGKLYIRKSAQLKVFPSSDKRTITADDLHYRINDMEFDEDGYIIYMGSMYS